MDGHERRCLSPTSYPPHTKSIQFFSFAHIEFRVSSYLNKTAFFEKGVKKDGQGSNSSASMDSVESNSC